MATDVSVAIALARSQQYTTPQSPPPVPFAERPRTAARSIRSRTTRSGNEYDESVRTSYVTESSIRPQVQPRVSKMSLFNLFSKPKVEKARGYAAEPLPASAPASKNALKSRSRLDLFSDDERRELQGRSASSLSYRNHTNKAVSNPTATKPAATSTTGLSQGEAVPLFQAYAQSTKHGVLQVSTMTAETVLQKTKHSRANLQALDSAPRGSSDDGTSIQSRQTTKTALRHTGNGSISSSELPRKVFVLGKAGRLYQYADRGPSDRLPERILQLGKDSAAFACDLIPGKHYVLQISQAVDQQGIVLASSGSFLSKLSMRSSASRRVATNFLLVMPDAAEMNVWMMAIREEIGILGGQRSRSEKDARPQDSATKEELDEKSGSPKKLQPYQFRSRSTEMLSHVQSPPPPREEDEVSDAGTIDEIEQEAEQLAQESKAQPESQADDDANSTHSSVAASLEQDRLNSLRSSQRISRSTVATTVASSRANSLHDSPRQEGLEQVNPESPVDSPQGNTQYRSLASYLGGRRRSAMPISANKSIPAPSPATNSQSDLRPHPVASGDSSMLSPDGSSMNRSPPRKLNVAASEPNLRATVSLRARHDSRMPTLPHSFNEDERPQSIVGDLPSPTTWGMDRSPNKRASLLQAATAQANAQRASILRGRTQKGKRQTTQPGFSLPLKINPSTPDNRPPTREEHRSSFNNVEEGNGVPTVHTLTAKIDATHLEPSGAEIPIRSPSRTPSGRLSLFPSPVPSPALKSAASSDSVKRLPSLASAQAAAQANGAPLRRPTSIQVRSDHAPFLSSARTSPHGLHPSPPAGRSFTAPIRSLKPSRSINQAALNAASQPSPTIPPSVMTPDLRVPSPTSEAADKPTPLPERAMSPLSPRPSSRASGRRVRTRSSLPELDLGIPVVALGPPVAPPPSAPLPLPPPTGAAVGISRPSSPVPGATGLGIKMHGS